VDWIGLDVQRITLRWWEERVPLLRKIQGWVGGLKNIFLLGIGLDQFMTAL
jgi:hypothetical protein